MLREKSGIPLTTAKNKTRNKPNQGRKDFYSENYKALQKLKKMKTRN
jgi:hypothetical protein